VVWESVLRKTKMVEHRSTSKLTICYIENEELLTLSILSNKENADLTKQEEIDRVLIDIDQHQVKLQKDKITKSPQEQLFEFIQTGFYITKNPIYKKLIDRQLK